MHPLDLDVLDFLWHGGVIVDPSLVSSLGCSWRLHFDEDLVASSLFTLDGLACTRVALFPRLLGVSVVDGLDPDSTSFRPQDLKDFGREAGSVSFADIDRDVPGQGILEYLNREDADNAIKTLDGKDLRGQPVRVSLAEESAATSRPSDNRRDDRYSRDDRHDRGDRFRDAPRRDRSRSPGYRRDYDRHDDRRFDDRRRSPPPRRDDDRRYDDRRDSRRDDRRDPEERRNGDGGWHRGGGRNRQNPTATTDRPADLGQSEVPA